jgi:hypothetical protein
MMFSSWAYVDGQHSVGETNMLPIGQALWLKHLQTYIDFPPLQNPASLRLNQLPSSECRGVYRDCTRYTCTGLGPG